MKKILSLLFCFCLLVSANAQKKYYQLFQISRLKNKNLICYDVNLNAGKIDNTKPIRVQWLNQEERPGARDDLSFFQEKMAYGYSSKSKPDNSFDITLKACSKKIITLKKHTNGIYYCFVIIRGKQAILKEIYIKTKSPDSNTVEYAELRGRTVDGNEYITEKVYP